MLDNVWMRFCHILPYRWLCILVVNTNGFVDLWLQPHRAAQDVSEGTGRFDEAEGRCGPRGEYSGTRPHHTTHHPHRREGSPAPGMCSLLKMTNITFYLKWYILHRLHPDFLFIPLLQVLLISKTLSDLEHAIEEVATKHQSKSFSILYRCWGNSWEEKGTRPKGITRSVLSRDPLSNTVILKWGVRVVPLAVLGGFQGILGHLSPFCCSNIGYEIII